MQSSASCASMGGASTPAGTDAAAFSERPRTSASQSSLSIPRTAARSTGTRSYCGSQVLSHKTSAPSFSFGSAPSRCARAGRSACSRTRTLSVQHTARPLTGTTRHLR
jgi:hypothetical protein